ncbi:hypothetical protein TNCV_1035131 [Trichonephila clavipes]|nr:hypothetical protein TNCV_1035131 [Trichonephila clavipes]
MVSLDGTFGHNGVKSHLCLGLDVPFFSHMRCSKVHELLLGSHKEFVHETHVPSVEGNARIFVAVERIRDMSGIFQNVRNSQQRPTKNFWPQFRAPVVVQPFNKSHHLFKKWADFIPFDQGFVDGNSIHHVIGMARNISFESNFSNNPTLRKWFKLFYGRSSVPGRCYDS